MPDAVGIIPLPPQQPYVSGNFTPPTLSDRLIGSPLGRFTHDAVVSPMEALAQNVLLGSPLAPMLQPGIDAGVGGIENAYQDALTANRNTPAMRRQEIWPIRSPRTWDKISATRCFHLTCLPWRE
jgi:hypothetical protein